MARCGHIDVEITQHFKSKDTHSLFGTIDRGEDSKLLSLSAVMKLDCLDKHLVRYDDIVTDRYLGMSMYFDMSNTVAGNPFRPTISTKVGFIFKYDGGELPKIPYFMSDLDKYLCKVVRASLSNKKEIKILEFPQIR